eukprot:788299-Alexandrium_andersonii.AAC.1
MGNLQDTAPTAMRRLPSRSPDTSLALDFCPSRSLERRQASETSTPRLGPVGSLAALRRPPKRVSD